ncbi:MAG: hypothetical protein ACN4GG_10030 [Akkermansiaceae bacterium]
MSLRSQLTDLLNDILPSNPRESIKGTELIRLVRMKLDGGYSDASLRYHFSIMSCDPNSPIAKVEKGQGYYKRGAQMPALSGAQEIVAMQQGRLDDLNDTSTTNQAMLRVQKFRAIVHKYAESRGQFTFEFRESLGQSASVGNLWKFPEMVFIDWEHGELTDDGLALDPAHLALKQTLGLPPYNLAAVRMRIEANYDRFREDLFQTKSAGLWANSSELFYASPIEDESLADQIRELSSQFGIGVTSFGLSAENLDDLPHPSQIANAMPRETEALMSRLNVERISPSDKKTHCGWETLDNLRNDHTEMNQFLAWLGGALESGIVRDFKDEA